MLLDATSVQWEHWADGHRMEQVAGLAVSPCLWDPRRPLWEVTGTVMDKGTRYFLFHGSVASVSTCSSLEDSFQAAGQRQGSSCGIRADMALLMSAAHTLHLGASSDSGDGSGPAA